MLFPVSPGAHTAAISSVAAEDVSIPIAGCGTSFIAFAALTPGRFRRLPAYTDTDGPAGSMPWIVHMADPWATAVVSMEAEAGGAAAGGDAVMDAMFVFPNWRTSVSFGGALEVEKSK